jgi:hypothetical protein
MIFTGLGDFVAHLKNAHRIGWKNVKDFWCMTFSKILGHAVYREGVTKKGGQRIEMSNPYAWCPYPGCMHSHEKGSTFRKHIEKCHESKTVPSMGIWALIAQLIKRDQDVKVCDLFGKTGGWICSQCGHFGPPPRSIMDHVSAKHRPEQDAQGLDCDIEPAVRQGFGEGEDPNLSGILQEAIDKAKAPRGDHWTKEDAEAYGREWHRRIMEQWHQGVQEKQISRAEAKFIRKEGAFPIFIKEHHLPMRKQWKGVSFEAIQGLYEHSI